MDIRTILACASHPLTAPAERARAGLRVLMYHRITTLPQYDQLVVPPERFAQQLAVLTRRRRVVSLADGLRALRAGALREPLVAVTFDDGYLDNLEEAAPILQRHGVPATVFVTADFCDQRTVHPRYAHVATGGGQVHLNWQQLRRLADLPGIEIGSHTLSHPYLQRLSDEQAREEVQISRDRIAQELGKPVRFFCYPSGDMGQRERELVAAAGYDAAVSVAPGRNRTGFDRWAIRRTEVTARDDERAFALKLDGAFDPMHALLHVRRQRRFARLSAGQRGGTRP